MCDELKHSVLYHILSCKERQPSHRPLSTDMGLDMPGNPGLQRPAARLSLACKRCCHVASTFLQSRFTAIGTELSWWEPIALTAMFFFLVVVDSGKTFFILFHFPHFYFVHASTFPFSIFQLFKHAFSYFPSFLPHTTFKKLGKHVLQVASTLLQVAWVR